MPSISIDFVFYFIQADLDADFLIDINLWMLVDVNKGEWVLKLNRSLYGIKQKSADWFDILNTGIERRGIINLKLTHM